MMLRSALNGGATKTRLMYGAYLSYAQLNEYVKALTERDLLNFNPDTRVFSVTPKGLEVLRAHDELERLMKTKGQTSRPPSDGKQM